MSRAAARHAFDELERRLVPLGVRRPRTAIALADLLGRARHALSRRWPAPAEVRDLFPGLGAASARRVAARIAGREARTRLVLALTGAAGLAPVLRLLDAPADAPEALAPPAVVATFHLGAWEALGPALERLAAPVLLLRESPRYEPRPPVAIAATGGGTEARAAAFHRALRTLETGGFVVLAVDVDAGPGIEVSCLGRPLALPRGAFSLARLAGAPVRPLVARWRARGVEVVAGPALGAPRHAGGPETAHAAEREVAAAVAHWLDGYLRAHPGDVGLGLLRELLAGPGGLRPEARPR